MHLLCEHHISQPWLLLIPPESRDLVGPQAQFQFFVLLVLPHAIPISTLLRALFSTTLATIMLATSTFPLLDNTVDYEACEKDEQGWVQWVLLCPLTLLLVLFLYIHSLSCIWLFTAILNYYRDYLKPFVRVLWMSWDLCWINIILPWTIFEHVWMSWNFGIHAPDHCGCWGVISQAIHKCEWMSQTIAMLVWCCPGPLWMLSCDIPGHL